MILILSKALFNEFLKKKNITDKNVGECKKTVFISICDSISSKSYFEKDHLNVLRLQFDDIIRPMNNYKLFNDSDAEKLIRFIELNKDKQFIIHCEAGISRSGAVGLFINDIYKKMSIEEFNKINSHIIPNQFIYHKLIKKYNNDIYDEIEADRVINENKQFECYNL